MSISQLGFVIFEFETNVEEDFAYDELCPTSFHIENCDCEALYVRFGAGTKPAHLSTALLAMLQ